MCPNPFFIKRPCEPSLVVSSVIHVFAHCCRSAITQAAIKCQLAQDDTAALKAGKATALHERCSGSGMVIAGVELEEAQYVTSLCSTVYILILASQASFEG